MIVQRQSLHLLKINQNADIVYQVASTAGLDAQLQLQKKINLQLELIVTKQKRLWQLIKQKQITFLLQHLES